MNWWDITLLCIIIMALLLISIERPSSISNVRRRPNNTLDGILLLTVRKLLFCISGRTVSFDIRHLYGNIVSNVSFHTY